MRYSFDEFFNDRLAPNLKKFFSELPPVDVDQDLSEEETVADKFLKILKDSYRGSASSDCFSAELLKLALNPFRDELSPEDYLKTCFQILFSNLDLRKIEYATNEGAIVSVNLNGTFEEQDLLERIRELIAEKS